ncbi:ribosomal protein S5 domain 2-type protein [Rhodotorula diobovata]|uniref:Ribosomal RNA-processing protein 43 n=1 Tax=Rhodotorula diobovata TaxID=5288 RepID=A0A5C5G4I9_9BASI|nr:ribosomal protein S5 domain 2-type protein [Rhodotorula diobovata]
MAVPAPRPPPATTTTPAAPQSNLTPTLFRRLFPRPYLERFLDQRIRPDGRTLDTSTPTAQCWREPSANTGSVSTAPSSTLVRLGKTSVVCGITLEVAAPDLTRPNEGFIVPNVDLSPLCSPRFHPGPPSDEAQVLSARLRDILLSSNVLPLSSLVIEPGKAAWVLYIDVVCLNFDGGVLDAAVLAAVGALRSLTFPEAALDPDTDEVVCERVSAEHPGRRIPPSSEPFCVSFGVFHGHLLPDPTLFEAELCTTQLTVVLGAAPDAAGSMAKAQLLHVHQAGAPLDDPRGTVRECVRLARRRAEELRRVVQV